MSRGLKLESNVLKVVESTHNLKIKNVCIFINKNYPIFGASSDGVTSDLCIEINENTAESEPSEAIVLSPEALQAIITIAVSAALSSMNLNQRPNDNRKPQVRLADISEQISEFGGDCE
ncbi:hypothetical protein CBL_08465 [Carabus blaptoides fortunei]